MVCGKNGCHFASCLSSVAFIVILLFHKLFLIPSSSPYFLFLFFFLHNASYLCFNYTYIRIKDTESQFSSVSSMLCVEETNSEINISHETTTMVVWIYDGV